MPPYPLWSMIVPVVITPLTSVRISLWIWLANPAPGTGPIE